MHNYISLLNDKLFFFITQLYACCILVKEFGLALNLMCMYKFHFLLFIGSAKKKKKGSKKSIELDKDAIIGTATIKIIVS